MEVSAAAASAAVVPVPKEQGKLNVMAYSDESTYKTPAENPYVIELLKQLGFETVEEFLTKSDLYDRKFD